MLLSNRPTPEPVKGVQSGVFFDQEEVTENFFEISAKKKMTKVVEVAAPLSGKEISFMFLF